uniref:Myb/SANT-like domain-containing protein n=1 Tax=Lactuca sativa TaxID=4236 RepID=A0A9R1XFH3_LACSA|nr:hypothetical protein LSAT_V11C400208500 [Lactuca sativa]
MKKPKFGWDNRSFVVFVDSCLIELRKSHKTGTYFNKVGRKQVIALKKITNKQMGEHEKKSGSFMTENKDYAKFRNTDLSIFDEKYALLFRDSVAIGDQTMTPLQFQNNSNQTKKMRRAKEIVMISI